jgi:beta-glucosidase/6-phospho-beta-glucosidase/beta-galactosidase
MVGAFDYGNYEKAADSAQDIGVKWNRLWFECDYFVDESGEIDLDEILFSDSIIDLALEHDIKLFAAVTMYSAAWDDELDSSRNEENIQKYEYFLAYLVEHFKGRIDYWEIWNEPEVDGFCKPAPNAVIYTQLLKRAYRKAKEANKEAKIIGLSSSLWSVDFIEETFQNDALNYMDILGLHPYCYLDSNYKSIFEISDDIAGLIISGI